MTFRRFALWLFLFLGPWMADRSFAADGVFVRFKLVEPNEARYYVKLGGYIHVEPWYLPAAVWPAGADKDASKRLNSGEFSPWFDAKTWAAGRLHGRMQRSGGVAEFPNVSATFVTSEPHSARRVVIELATAADEKQIVKRFEETLSGERTSFLISPALVKDRDGLESLSQMQSRQLQWAREAAGGKRASPKQHILYTSFYGPSLEGAEVLSLLGFNVVGSQTPEIHAKFPELVSPGHTHNVDFGPAATQASIEGLMKSQAPQYEKLSAGVPFGFADEICCRPAIGTNAEARAHFHAWLAARGVAPKDLGVAALTDAVPIETPQQLQEQSTTNAAAARRTFYYTCRFRQEAGTERIRWHTEALHRNAPAGLVSNTLVADHPYFSGTGLGLGLKTSNGAWGGYPLALDWFDLARRKAVDMIAVEDWMGLQYMYGPHFTWEGFQLMGFQSAIMRSGSRAQLPIMALITPSDETNLVLKTSSALAQGAKHFFYWTYGPTAFGTENYWSDLRGEYDGVARIARQLAAAESITGPGTTRKTRVALLYSISSDLWQPFGYIHMLERRAAYLALVHEQYLVDMLTEEDLVAGRLKDYDVLYATDACISSAACAEIERWVGDGGFLWGSCAAGSRNEFDEPASGLAKTFGIDPAVTTQVQPGAYSVRGGLNGMTYLDEVSVDQTNELGEAAKFGALGVKVRMKPTTARVIGHFGDGTPAAAINSFGKGKGVYFAACPGLSYLKDAHFVAAELKERYPATQRRLLQAFAAARGVPRLVELSAPVVEAGVYDAPTGAALVLANFTYQPIEKLTVRVPLVKDIRGVRSVEHGVLSFQRAAPSPALRAQGYTTVAVFVTKLGLNDILLLK